MIYFVTDRTLCSKEHYLKTIRKCCNYGVEAIILREKDLKPEGLLSLAEEVKAITKESNTKLIINSNLDVAKKIGADGVHLSYKDFSGCKDIKSYGIVGVSVHSYEEGKLAYENGADYIMYGHVFESSCKKGIPPRGLKDIKELRKIVTIPIVAIGGINKDNFKEALNAGADKIAIRSGILECHDVCDYLNDFKL